MYICTWHKCLARAYNLAVMFHHEVEMLNYGPKYYVSNRFLLVAAN